MSALPEALARLGEALARQQMTEKKARGLRVVLDRAYDDSEEADDDARKAKRDYHRLQAELAEASK